MSDCAFILVTFKPQRREERFKTQEELEAKAALLSSYGVKVQTFKEDVKVVRARLSNGAH